MKSWKLSILTIFLLTVNASSCDLKECENHLNQAKYFFIIPDCINSTLQANKANDCYEKCLRQENTLSENNTVEYYLKNTEEVKKRILSTCSGGPPSFEFLYYKPAQDAYLQGEYKKAEEHILKHIEINKKLKNYIQLSKGETLLSQIQIRKSIFDNASKHHEMAKNHFFNEEYDKCIKDAETARKIFQQIKHEKSLIETNELKTQCMEAKLIPSKQNKESEPAITVYNPSPLEIFLNFLTSLFS